MSVHFVKEALIPKVTQAHLESRRREILTAAHQCFARRGPRETTMQDVADEAGLSAGALYRYFDGKEALLEALADWGRELKQEALHDLEPGGGAAALSRAVVAMLEPLAHDAAGTEDALRLDVRLWSEALDQPRIRRLLEKQMAAVKDPVAEFLRGERRAGRIRGDVAPQAVAEIVLALLIGLELQKAFASDLDVARYSKTLKRLLESLSKQ